MNFKITKLLLFSILFMSFQALQAQNYWLSSMQTALAKAKQSNQPILLDVYADWCGYCRRMQRDVYPDTLVQKLTDRFVRVRLNGEQHPEIMRKYKISGFPTMVFLDENGRLLEIARGYHSQSRMTKKLQSVLYIAGRKQRILDQLKEAPTNVHWNYRAGLYFYESGQLKLAEMYFSKAVSQKANVKMRESARDALFNLAIVHMDQKLYQHAIRKWSNYLQKYPREGQDTVYARYYRGVSYYLVSNRLAARSDLSYAIRNLNKDADRMGARQILKQLN